MEQNYILPFLWMKGESREVIQEELEKIAECGIGAVCLESRPHPDFMGPKWWEDVAFIIEECKRRNMKLWILDDAHFPTGYANGLIKNKYPERKKHYLNYNVVNVWGKQGKVSVQVKEMTKPLVSFLDIGKPMDFAEREKNKLVAVTAYPLRDGKKLEEEGALDLTDFVQGDYLDYEFPKDNYRIFVVYDTCTDGGNPDYINMMDYESVSTQIEAVYAPHYEHFKEEFGKTIAGFFSDEPPIGNLNSFSGDNQIGNPKMPLPWSEELKKRFMERFGDGWRTKLAYLWNETVQMEECPQVRYGFMDLVTCLYRENFSLQLGNWCSDHGVEYIGHIVEDENLHQRLGSGIGHYFRAMEGQHMAGIDAISDQITVGDEGYTRSGVFERDGSFFHYALAKLGASAGHLDARKNGRTMCELFGASGWETGVRNMRYILDHLLVRGVNYLVPHAFSMSEYPDEDCPPHFYARGNNPQFKYFAKLMKYANRMCHLLQGGCHKANVAVLYPGDCEWGGKAMLLQEIAKELQQGQIEFDVVSADMLAKAGPGRMEHGKGEAEPSGSEDSFSINGQRFSWLIIPECEGLPFTAARFIQEHPKVHTVFVNEMPKKLWGQGTGPVEIAGEIVGQTQLAEYLRQQGAEQVFLPKPCPDLVYYHYCGEQELFMFHNENAFTAFRGEIMLPLEHGAVYYDGMADVSYALPVREEQGKKYVEIELLPYNACVILDRDSSGLLPYRKLSEELSACGVQKNLDGAWNYGITTEKKFPEPVDSGKMEQLMPVSDLIPEFSGHVFYEKGFSMAQKPEKAYLEFTEVYECLELYVNEVRIGDALCMPYVFEVTEALQEGENRIKAIVTGTLDRDQVNYKAPFVRLDFHVSEPVGLCGEVRLYTK